MDRGEGVRHDCVVDPPAGRRAGRGPDSRNNVCCRRRRLPIGIHAAVGHVDGRRAHHLVVAVRRAGATGRAGLVRRGGPRRRKVTFSGSAAFSIGKGYVTNLSQSGLLSGTDGASFYERVGEGTYTLPFSLATTAPKAADANKIGDVIGYISASVSSRNCNDWGLCGGPSARLSLAVVGHLLGHGEADRLAGEELQDLRQGQQPDREEAAQRGAVPAETGHGDERQLGQGAGHDARLLRGDGGWRSQHQRVRQAGSLLGDIAQTAEGLGTVLRRAQSKDKAGNYSPIKCKWLSIAVPITRVKVNGCGTDGDRLTAEWLQNYFGDVREYGTGSDRTQARLRNACNIHDAAYTGITIFDALDKQYVDFRQWTRLEIDAKFRNDIRALCRRVLSKPKSMAPYLHTCTHGQVWPRSSR